MASSKKGSSLTVPTDHEPDRLNRLVASVPEAMRSRRRKGFAAKHDLVEVHGNRVGPPSRWPLRANMRVRRTAKPQRNGNGTHDAAATSARCKETENSTVILGSTSTKSPMVGSSSP